MTKITLISQINRSKDLLDFIARLRFRNEAEIYGTFRRVRLSLKYAILRSCNRAQTGRIGLNRYVA